MSATSSFGHFCLRDFLSATASGAQSWLELSLQESSAYRIRPPPAWLW
jgi:hypothetical protein